MSIQIIPNGGRYGNQLFLYFLGRILSEELGFKLFGSCIHDELFEKEQLQYLAFDQPLQELNDSTLKTLEDLRCVLSDKTPRKITISDYMQRKELFIHYKHKIKKWFNQTIYNIPKTHVALHIRLGDLVGFNALEYMLPLEYYQKALDLIKFDNVTICSDSPEHPLVQTLVQQYNANIFNNDEKETISFLASHNNLILSQGSFSFWAGFFCDGETIINAIPTGGWNSHPETNLLVYNDVRYKNIKI